ncbi:arginyltransferase [Chitinilyticum piscinae]|uniref:Aspartate/glutamate leucyltransferase n=1 Tax=Chitinilyticum piscinae TaxID=2866724 RepID=A0A8J7K2Z4_9NEIS|nr:arginyltransferase [Chitinilyticum piscinae]MBE9610672.1 arginyltransferase [Chitinilyticum piscinae]
MRDGAVHVPLQFYATANYECSYLPERQARSQVVVPSGLIDQPVYSELVRQGFRRSGQFVYRPWCDHCRACIPVRVCVDEFSPSRTQRKVMQRLSAIRARLLPLNFHEQHFQLYLRYQHARHSGGGMDEDTRDQYANFILQSGVSSMLAEFVLDEQVVMVSLIDQLDDGLSAVYTFFDPELVRASLGVYNVLWQVGLARQLGLPFVYLGYWIRECRKMAYKDRYRPFDALIEGRWQRVGDQLDVGGA